MVVYLTLQKNEGYGEKQYTRVIAIQKCGNYPYEIAVRFAGCGLSCGACFASGYSWFDSFRDHYRVVENVEVNQMADEFINLPNPPSGSYNWMRILGGEPLLNDEYINYLFDFIVRISKEHAQKFNNGVVVQTNGIHIGKGNINVIKDRLEDLYNTNSNVLVTVETSIKGTNENEFELITRSSRQLYKFNIQSYYNLLDLGLPNLRSVVIAGLGINESFLQNEGRSRHIISLLYDENTPTFHPSIWDDRFTTLYSDFINRNSKLDPKFNKMPMYGIKDQFQYGWVRKAMKQTKAIYDDKVYDAEYSKRNFIIEQKFYDILGKFFYPDNQEYYSLLIKK